MRRWSGLIWLAGSVLLVGLLSRATRHDPALRNLETMAEMVYAPAYDAYEPNPLFADRRTLRLPVAGSIPRGYLPLVAGAPLTLETAKELVNPVAVSATTLKQGAQLFAIFCQVCHGVDGLGDGTVTRRGVPPPPAYTYESLAAYTGGQLFQIMTEGKGNMAGYKGQIGSDDRWKLVRHLQNMRTTP